jgi:hypothetical protein
MIFFSINYSNNSEKKLPKEGCAVIEYVVVVGVGKNRERYAIPCYNIYQHRMGSKKP